MAKVKISELPSLSPATLDTTYVVGVSGSTTYKISINQLTSSLDTTFATDLVVNAISGTISTLATTTSLNTLSTSVDSRIDTLETFSSSADNRYVLSGSITQTTWDNIANKPNDIVSSSTQISDLGFVTGSYTTLNSFNNLTQSFNSISQSFTTISGSFGDIDFSGINAVTESYLEFTQSYYSASASVDIRITTEKNRIDAILSASNVNSDTFAEVVSLINSVDLTNDNAFATFYTASNSRITSLENATSSYLTSLNGAISSSSQLTSSFDTRYILSGSVTQTTWGNISGKPDGIVSQSTDLSFLNTFTQSIDSRVDSLENATSSYLTSLNGAISSSSQVLNGSGIFSSSAQLPNGLISSSLGFVATSSYTTDSASFNSRIISGSAVAGTISGSTQISNFGFITGSYVSSSTFNTFTASVTTMSTSVDSRLDIVEATASLYTPFSTSVDSRLDTLEASIITGSVNYVQTLGARVTGVTSTGVTIITGSITTTGNPIQIMVTGDANPVNVTSWTRLQIYRDSTPIGNIVQVENSSNLNVPYCLNVIDTPSAGTYTYSMRTVSGISGLFDFGESTGPTLTAVELKTNTNLPSTNNTFTGTNVFSGSTTLRGAVAIGTSSGDEGGEINLAIASTNQTLTGSVNIDVYRNSLRLWEGGGTNRGVYIDLSKAPAGNSGELMWKSSGLLNTGLFVTLDNVKVGPTRNGAGGGFAGLSVGAVSTSFVADISATYSNATIGGTSATGVTYTTTASNSAFGWGFTQGHQSTYILNDTTNSRVYRITLMIGASYNNNFISIERLY